MATINGSDNIGNSVVRWTLPIAATLLGAGIAGLVWLTVSNSIMLSHINGQLDSMEKGQIARDGEQNRWIDYFRERLDEGRERPQHDPPGGRNGN